MPTYQAAATSPAAASGAPYASFHTNGRRAFIRELGFFVTAAAVSAISLGQAGNNATPPVATTSVTPLAQDFNTTSPDAAAVSRLDTAWSTAPTVPGTFWRKATLAGSIGQGWILKLASDERIILGQTTAQWMAVWNHGTGAGAALDLYAMYDE